MCILKLQKYQWIFQLLPITLLIFNIAISMLYYFTLNLLIILQIIGNDSFKHENNKIICRLRNKAL